MISWIVITILVVVGIFAIKMNHLKHRVFIIMLIMLALFLYSSMALVTTKNELSFDNSEGLFNSEHDPRSLWATNALYLNRKYTKLNLYI